MLRWAHLTLKGRGGRRSNQTAETTRERLRKKSEAAMKNQCRHRKASTDFAWGQVISRNIVTMSGGLINSPMNKNTAYAMSLDLSSGRLPNIMKYHHTHPIKAATPQCKARLTHPFSRLMELTTTPNRGKAPQKKARMRLISFSSPVRWIPFCLISSSIGFKKDLAKTPSALRQS